MTDKTEMVSVPRELLQDLIDSAQLEVDERVRAYGEDYRPHVLAAQRKVVADASAILAAPAEDVRAVGDEPVLIQAVAVTREDEDEGLRLEWLLEGGISELEFAGTVLFAMPEANDICVEDGSAEVYRHPQRPVVLPERRSAFLGFDPETCIEHKELGEIEGWNACLNEFARLNP